MNVKRLREFLSYEGCADDDEVLIAPEGILAKEQYTLTMLSHRKGIVIITGTKTKELKGRVAKLGKCGRLKTCWCRPSSVQIRPRP